MKAAFLFSLFFLCFQGVSRAEESGQLVYLRFDGKNIPIQTENNAASRDFISMLPLELKFTDFNNTEKIAYLPRKLRTENSPAACDPEIGTLAYYMPWGNIAVFYRDFPHSENLVPLGKILSGIEQIKNIGTDTDVSLILAQEEK